MQQWLEDLQANGIAYGSKVKFDLPTSMKLDMVKGKWQYRPLALTTYEGEVTGLKPNQLTVWVESEKKSIVVHPSMVRPVNVLLTLLQDVR